LKFNPNIISTAASEQLSSAAKKWHRPSTHVVQSPPFIFKRGDDLRQDMAVLQIFRLINRLWMLDGLCFKGLPVRALEYGCLALGADKGCIESVPDCESLRKVVKLSKQLSGPGTRENLVASAAGAYMASYVLGVGDRHFDNILIRADGCLFHIDFGHILGGGVAFDTADFAITPDLQQV
jgi:phosphatidylinositol kinase/protein kinase (PI-3  family)